MDTQNTNLLQAQRVSLAQRPRSTASFSQGMASHLSSVWQSITQKIDTGALLGLIQNLVRSIGREPSANETPQSTVAAPEADEKASQLKQVIQAEVGDGSFAIAAGGAVTRGGWSVGAGEANQSDAMTNVQVRPVLDDSPVLVGDYVERDVPLAQSDGWINAICSLFSFGSGKLPATLGEGVRRNVEQASSDVLKSELLEQLEQGDVQLAHDLFTALGEPGYQRNRSDAPESRLQDFVHYLTKQVYADDLQHAIVQALPEDRGILMGGFEPR